MLHLLLLSVAPQFVPLPPWPEPLLQSPPAAQKDPEYDRRKREAGKDVGRLWKLYEWCVEQKKDKEAKAALREILKLDPLHKDANVASGNLYYDGKWFANEKKIEEYKQQKEREEKLAQGLVEYKGEWVPAADVPFLEQGLVRAPDGRWVAPEEARKLVEGWTRQDLEWVAPADKHKLEAGLWKCGDEWLPLAEANAWHAELPNWWRIPGEGFTLYTTCDREVGTQKVAPQLVAALVELERIYGQKPAQPPIVIVLRDAPQYGNLAAGDQAEDRPPTELNGLSSVHYAYFADLGFEPGTNRFWGAGVGYWDAANKEGDRWGVHSVRHALGQSFAEALDPSSAKALEKLAAEYAKGQINKRTMAVFQDEKRVPEWVRHGAAAYVERYYVDKDVGVGGDPLWTRKWSVQNIQAKGGLRQLKQILEFKLRVEMGPDGTKLINEAGLVMAFVLDGECAPVQEKFKVLQELLRNGGDKKALTAATKALEDLILKHEADLRKFAGL